MLVKGQWVANVTCENKGNILKMKSHYHELPSSAMDNIYRVIMIFENKNCHIA
jgi:hypothetical protein